MASQKLNFYIAAVLNPLSDKECEYLEEGLLVVQVKEGRSQIKDLMPLALGLSKYEGKMTKVNTVRFRSSVIMPGFYDMHFHWVQDDVREMPKDSLLDWLDKYTFPAEMKFASGPYARKKAKIFFERLAKAGTIGGACYSSVHEHAVDAAMKEAKGDFVIGNVIMNMNSPKELVHTEAESISAVKKLIKKHGRRYCFTPRFAITTTPGVMKAGARLADKARCFKQTHLSETPKEIDFVLSLYRQLPGFEKVRSYTEIYEKTGMLGERSLMGHGIHLSKEELKVLSKTSTAVVHCPTSNAPIEERGLGSGLFDFRKVEKAKVKWALGSDIGGGPILSMFDVMRSFVEQNSRKKIKGATYIKALYRSTLAGAEIMGLAKKKGNLSKGKEANFIVVPLKDRRPEGAEEVLRSLIEPYRHSRSRYDKLIKVTYLNGRPLFGQKSGHKKQVPCFPGH